MDRKVPTAGNAVDFALSFPLDILGLIYSLLGEQKSWLVTPFPKEGPLKIVGSSAGIFVFSPSSELIRLYDPHGRLLFEKCLDHTDFSVRGDKLYAICRWWLKVCDLQLDEDEHLVNFGDSPCNEAKVNTDGDQIAVLNDRSLYLYSDKGEVKSLPTSVRPSLCHEPGYPTKFDPPEPFTTFTHGSKTYLGNDKIHEVKGGQRLPTNIDVPGPINALQLVGEDLYILHAGKEVTVYDTKTEQIKYAWGQFTQASSLHICTLNEVRYGLVVDTTVKGTCVNIYHLA